MAGWVHRDRLPDRVFLIGVNQAPPYNIIHSDNSFGGLAVEVISEAARRRGISLKWVPMRTLDLDEALASRAVDLWPVAAITPERLKRIHITKPWIQNQFCLLSTKEMDVVSPLDLAGLTVAHAAYPMATKMAQRFFARTSLIPKPNPVAVVAAVCRGEVPAGFLEARSLDPVMLKRPAGCESTSFSIHFVKNATSAAGIASTPETAVVADAIRSEISNLVADGSFFAIMEKWSSFSAGEARSLFALQQAQRRAQIILYGFLALLVGASVLFRQFRVARSLRRVAERANLLETDRNRVFEKLATTESLESVLTSVSEMVERQHSNLVCTVAVCERDLLTLVCRSRLAEGLARSLAQVEMYALPVCSGAAAFRPQLVVSTDMERDDRWESVRSEVRRSGLRSCWALPVRTSSGQPLGVIAVYSPSKFAPNAARIQLIESAAHLAGLVMERRKLHEQLRRQANHDSLTGLPNRVLLLDRLEQALASARRQSRQLAIFCIDLDRFKRINDTFGHAAGDIFLQHIAGLIRNSLRDCDTLARMGGDEFTVLVPEIESPEGAELLAERLLQALREPILVEGVELFGSASVGISIYPRHGATAADLQRNADRAMYQAKEAGENGYKLFEWATPHDSSGPDLEREVHHSLQEEHFELH
ncbi:MAG: diguanylate cyclase [Acidobacteriota bacterium]|nr:diguanylate cyclase [Acidobacteriota bacterium]